eukprot:m.303485 g.303485  ORF g.303485 m.303485 type:complete len:631 (-) comp55250_c0_seq2:34-1926(-)
MMSDDEDVADKRRATVPTYPVLLQYTDQAQVIQIHTSISAEDDPANTTLRLLAQGAPLHLQSAIASTLATFQQQKRQAASEEECMRELEKPAADQQQGVDQCLLKFMREHGDYVAIESDSAGKAEFHEVYNALVHSQALRHVIQLEESFAPRISEALAKREKALGLLSEQQAREVASARESAAEAPTASTDRYITDLISTHNQRLKLLDENLASEIGGVRDRQRREFRHLLKLMHDSLLRGPAALDAFLANDKSPIYLASTLRAPLADTPGSPALPPIQDEVGATVAASASADARPRGLGRLMKLGRTLRPRTKSSSSQNSTSGANVEEPVSLEESFTVHLGTQMKRSQNMRLLSGSEVTLCRYDKHEPQQAHALHIMNAISLYSQRLSALVILVDGCLGRQVWDQLATSSSRLIDFCLQVTGHGGRFRSGLRTDNGFPLRGFSNAAPQHSRVSSWGDTLTSCGRSWFAQATIFNCSSSLYSRVFTLHMFHSGDFYVTRHSNLADIQVVIHLVVAPDEALGDNLLSRSSVLAGLRNVISYAFKHGIFKLTLPLLMWHTLTEEMNTRWCLRRAETVLKCVKGYIMENAVWASPEPRTFQFIVPPDISEETFEGLSQTFTTVFRVSHAVTAK